MLKNKNVREKAKIRNQYNQVSHMEKWQKHKNTYTRDLMGQRFPNRWPQGCKEQTNQYDKDNHETQVTKLIDKRNTTLERSVRKLLEGLNMFDGTSH